MTKEEAIHIIENVNANTNCDNCFYKYDATCEDCRVETALNMAIETLANQKTGHWIKDEEMSIMFDIWECSECGSGGDKHFKYCSYCGAKMEGE